MTSLSNDVGNDIIACANSCHIRLISHGVRRNSKKLGPLPSTCLHMHSKMLQHLDWLQKVSKIVLKDVNVSVEDYIDRITTPGVPLDFVALLALCRFYHFHVAVFTTVGVWSTARVTKDQNCLFGVVYNSNFQFTEMVGIGRGDSYCAWLEQ